MRRRCQILLLAVVTACGSTERPRPRAVPASPSPVALAGPQARFVAFAGEPIEIPGDGSAGAASVEPALPAGLSLDLGTGAVRGSVAAPMPPAEYAVVDPAGGARRFVLEVIAAPGPDDRFVAPTGDDAADGSRAHPYRTIHRAITDLVPGRRVFLAAGRYREDVVLRRVEGTEDRPIVIRALPGAVASIEGVQAAVTWQRATGAPDEWVSTETFARDKNEATNRGAFADRVPFTRLLTYSRREDLEATNQRWERDGNLPGGKAVKGPQRPWTYFGPGLWHDPDGGRVYLRLSPTANGVTGLDDYTGPTDPGEVALSIWARSSTPLVIERSAYVEIRDLAIVGGGDRTVSINNSRHVTLDHTDILAATVGLTIGESTSVRYTNGRMDGGIPTWSFRSDFKDNYRTVDEDDGSTEEDNLVRKTSRGLVYVAGGNEDIEIAHSELENAHDIYMAGVRSSVHHCRIRNIHDESMFIGHVKDIDDLRIHHNVFERVLSAITVMTDRGGNGVRYVYRNIFDLREPTAGFRPGGQNPDTWRWGHVFKQGIASGMYFFQNTVLQPVVKQGKPALAHFAYIKDTPRHPLWFANNLVVVGGGTDHPLSWVPDPSLLGGKDASGRPLVFSDGNAWVRLSTPGHVSKRKAGGPAPLFRCVTAKTATCAVPRWTSLDDVRGTGFEHHSRIATDASFARMTSFEAVTAGDDLRPGAGSPALGTAVALPAELGDDAGNGDPADAGALGAGAPPLRVGVDGRFVY
jgi:hypothetical protein